MNAIKAKVSKREKATCFACKANKKSSIALLDVKINKTKFCLCDECNSDLFNILLKFDVAVNAKLKNSDDIGIIKIRKIRKERLRNKKLS
jgi:hypothetical protein